ncbi:DUF418 domain-containing protein [Sphingomicrobium nitratireducens]|uniref:DUF418 domain-containing protein n=1 Tax=Sphingomicrobium nitratireducens TaxID=2964666 RepID=UPI00223ECAEB|nr:DUF418 domain-containing protein [Sphingomicrobium nitratireducens]
MATTQPDRIISLDLIRGLAVLGIFSVNIIGMSFMQGVYFVPTLQGFDGLGDHIMYLVNFVLVDGKLRSLFSMLFGASMLLVVDRAVAAGRSGAKVHYARIFWLLVIGLLHYYVFWWGDILSHYALIGGIAYFWWRRSAKVLLIWAAAFLTFNLGFSMFMGYQNYQQMQAELAKAQTEAIEAGKPAPTLEEMIAKEDGGPPREVFDEAKAIHANLITHTEEQVSNHLAQPFMVSVFLLPETLGLMLLGMGLYRAGFLTGERDERTYRKWALWGWGGSALFTIAVAAWIAAGNYSPMHTGVGRSLLTLPTRPIMAIGYAALMILWIRGGMNWLSTRLAAAGRMAFTNYLGATLVMTPIMFGFGLGQFGELTRGTAWLYFVPVLWLAMLVGSKWWLDRYRYGPLEWVWRSLARWEIQPMRKAAPALAAPAAAQ